MNTEKKAMSVAETASALGVTRQTVYNQLLHRADFPSFHVGTRILISAAGLERWIEAQTERGGTQQ